MHLTLIKLLLYTETPTLARLQYGQDIVRTTNVIQIGHTSELQWFCLDQITAVKAAVVRKSLGPKGPCGFDSRPGHSRQMHDICNLPSWCQVLFISSGGWERNLRDYPWQMQFLNFRKTNIEYGKIWVGCWIEKIWPVEVANEADTMQIDLRVRLPFVSKIWC